MKEKKKDHVQHCLECPRGCMAVYRDRQIEIQSNFPILKHFVLSFKASFSGLLLEKMHTTLGYSNLGFKCIVIYFRCKKDLLNQRTNGPVNAHLRSASYLNIMVFNPSEDEALGPFWADEALGPFSFFRIINILSICQFPAGFPLQITF